MGFLDRLFGRREEPPMQPAALTYDPPGTGGQQRLSEADEQALQRYRYMLRTAPPETIEQAHEEAFAKLTPAQRAQTLRELAGVTPENERGALAGGQDDPKSLARLATRAEMRQPGVMERIFGGTSRGPIMGGMGGTLLGSLAAGFVGSMIAQEFLGSVGGFGEGDTSGYSGDDSGDYSSGDSTSDDSEGGSDYGSDDSGGYSDADSGGYGDDLGGDSGSDWGGGDFGGGDW